MANRPKKNNQKAKTISKMKNINRKQDFLILRGCILHQDELTFTDKLLLSKLIELWVNCETVKISNNKLSQLLGVSKKSIINSNKKLKELELITTNEEYSEDGDRTSNTYILNESRINDFLETDLFEIEDTKKQQQTSNSNNKKESVLLKDFGEYSLYRWGTPGVNATFWLVKNDDKSKHTKLNGSHSFVEEFAKLGIDGVEVYNNAVIDRTYER